MKHSFGRTLFFCLAWVLAPAGLILSRAEMVLISEIMYHPKEAKPEYIEVFNNTATPFDMADWRLTGGVRYDFPPISTANPGAAFLKAFERLVLSSADDATTRQVYSIPATVRIFGPWSGRLNDRSDRITLLDKNGLALSTVEYGDRGRWSAAADGAGHSLVLQNPNKPVDDWRNWAASTSRDGTPGTEPILSAEMAVLSPEINLSQGVVLIDYGDVWRYHDRNQDLGTNWRSSTYDDQSWPEGPGLLGFETAALPPPGIRTSLNRASQLTFYFRKQFVFSGDLARATLTIDQVLDDGAVYYLNGTEIGRSRMGGGAIGFNTAASETVTDAVEERGVITVDGRSLVEGVNVLAVEVHQTNPTSSDLVFGVRLRASVPAQPGLVINEVLPQAAGLGFIEFYNPTVEAVNLRDHYLSDNAANLRKLRITTDLAIPARGLGAVGFVESGFELRSPVIIYLTAPDGTSAISALSSAMALDGRSLGQKPAGSGQWFLFTDPTRNEPNASHQLAAQALRLNEVHFSAGRRVEWVELYNASQTALSIDQLFLSARRDFTDRVPLTGQIPVGGHATFTVNFTFDDEIMLFLVNAAGTVLDARTLQYPARGTTLQAFPDGSNEWFSAASSTPGQANDPERHTEIIINEIMYDPPSDQVESEYIELYNRGAATVDLSGWRFEDGIDFRFPEGTLLAAREYLVVAANAARLRDDYGAIRVMGDFQGRLSNRGELIRLVDAWGNLADAVDYKVGGDWPDLANGGGSSMELLHASMDNNLGAAWKDSDETNKGPFRSYAYRDTYRQLRTFGGPADYKEIYFHLVGEGHVMLRDIRFIRVSTGEDLLVNADRLSLNAASASGWLAQGTHWASYITNGQFHILSDGRGDNRPNRVELDAIAMNSGDLCEIRFNARWVSGSPRLIFSTWDHSIANSFLLEIPQNLGTPGQPNSRALPQPAPQIDRVQHSPAVPHPTQNVRITATVSSATPLAAVEVYHRADDSNGSGTWLAKPMFDDGLNGGDQQAGDGVFTAELNEYRVNGRIVQFYVQARAGNGQASLLPKHGASKPALFVVDSRTTPRDLRVARFVVSEYDLGAISNGNSPKYQYKFPRLSNAYKNATFISNEEEIFYNAEIRNSGSPWTRGGSLERGKFKLPQDRAFRSHVKFYFDNDPQAGRMYHNRITRYWLYLLGHPASENEFIRVIVNSGSPALREDTEFVGNDFLDRVFPEGSDGELYRIDDEWWFTDSWDRQNRDADWSYKSTDNPGRYRTEWMKRTREDEDDFTALISFFKIVSGSYSQSEIERIIDPEATMKMFAVRGYVNDWDSISLNRGKNGFFYRRPTDGLFQFLQWDSDLTFGDPNSPLYSGLPRVGPYIAKPYNLRRFYYYIAEMVEQYTQNSPRMEAWFEAEEQASPSFTINAGQYRSWFSTRNAFSRQRMGANYTRSLAITTNQGQPLTTADDQIALSGTAPYGTFAVTAAGHPEATLTWTSAVDWTLAGIQLKSGENQVQLAAVDQWGAVRQELSMPVTKIGNAAPVLRLTASPRTWIVPVQDVLSLDARDSFDPEGTPLSFAWQVTPAPSLLETNQAARMVVRFQRPGWYQVALQASDRAGQSAQLLREVAVSGPGGFSAFGGLRLEDFWQTENVAPRQNVPASSWFSLDERAGALTIQALGDTARPLAATGSIHPLVWRALPAGDSWSLQTELQLDTQVYGEYQAGLLVEAIENGAPVRYVLGIDGGRTSTVKRVPAFGAPANLAAISRSSSQASYRIRRAIDRLWFEEQINDAWVPVHSLTLPKDTATPKAGLFIATSQPETVRVHFAYAALIDPSLESSLQSDLRVTEIMYNPIGGETFEFIELANIGSGTLDLTGARFTNGITFVFGAAQLGPGEHLAVVKDLSAFTSRYGAAAPRAVGDYSGRLDNAGETITLVDLNGRVIFSFRYGTDGDWPGRPDGFGSSLEVVNPRADLNDPDNWRSSTEYLGSPGKSGIGPLQSVVINEVLTHTDSPLEDAIELHNRAGTAIDISGWFLSDARSDYRKFRIPNGTILLPNGYHVLYELQFNTNNTRVPFSLSSVRGDQIYLTSADASGNLVYFVDNVSFGPSENGVSFGRFPNGTGPLVAMAQLTLGTTVTRADPPEMLSVFRTGLGAPNTAPKVGPVVFRQIMYHPVDGDGEFVELFNITGMDVPLYDPQTPVNTWKILGGIEYDFPPGFVLPANGSVLISGLDPEIFRARYDIPSAIPVFGPFTGRLDNAGESIELFKPDPPVTAGPDLGTVPYILVERVRYHRLPPWPVLADGSGPALRRVNPLAYANDPANWTAGIEEPDPDSDGDGMPDWWEIAHGFDPNSPADASLDLDNDGFSNLHEYLTGTNPRDSSSRFQVDAVHSDGAVLAIEFIAVADRSYSLQHRPNVAAGAWTTVAEVAPRPATETVRLEINPAPSSAAGFYRVLVPTR